MNTQTADPVRALADFRSDHYLRINARRLEHLATLGLPLRNARVAELGAGVGDLTGFFLDRACSVLSFEGREANASIYRERFAHEPNAECRVCDLNAPPSIDERFDVTFCYGLLYHLSDPRACIDWMAAHTTGLIVLSTCVTPDHTNDIHPTSEDATFHSQALDGAACRPSRQWIFEALRAEMPHVYTARTQPNHDEFPLDWSNPTPSQTGLHRAVFVASRAPLHLPTLHEGLLDKHDPAP